MMSEERARSIADSAIKISREAGNIFRSLKKDDDYLKDPISAIIYDILENVVHPIMDDYPNIKSDIEARMNSVDDGHSKTY